MDEDTHGSGGEDEERYDEFDENSDASVKGTMIFFSGVEGKGTKYLFPV